MFGREIRKSYFLIPVTVNVVFQSVASLKSVALYGQVPFLVTERFFMRNPSELSSCKPVRKGVARLTRAVRYFIARKSIKK